MCYSLIVDQMNSYSTPLPPWVTRKGHRLPGSQDPEGIRKTSPVRCLQTSTQAVTLCYTQMFKEKKENKDCRDGSVI